MSNTFDPAKLKARFLRSLGANAFGQMVTIGIQLASVPLFIYFWGVEKYGEWLILSAIPAYLNLSDIGFASVAGNEMTILSAKEDRAGVLAVYQSGWALISGISTLVLMFVAACLALFNPASLLNISHIPSADIAWILLLLAAQVLISLQGGMFSGGFRAVGKNATGIMFNNSIRLFEWSAAAVVLVLDYGTLGVAATFFVCRLLGTLIYWWKLKQVAPWLVLGFAHVHKKLISTLLKPAIAFMAFPLGLAISLQGAVIVIGAVLGPASVAVFSAYRTLSRLLVQAITMVSQAIWPEISAAYGANNMALVRTLHRRGFVLAFWLGLGGVIAVGLLGNWFVGIWTHHQLPSQPTLLWLLLIVAYFNILWQSSWVVLMATNRHLQVAKLFVVAAFISLLLISIVAGRQGIESAALILALAELPLLLSVIHAANKLIEEKKSTFFLSPFRLVRQRSVN